jgi:hypothetical protein
LLTFDPQKAGREVSRQTAVRGHLTKRQEMKKIIVLILILFCFTNISLSQKKIDLQKYSLDTLSLLIDIFFVGPDNRQYKQELLNTFDIDGLNALTTSDSIYIFSLKQLPFKEEFGTDGNYENIFLNDSTINRLTSCTWIELNEIKLKKHCIILKIIRHKKINSVIINSVLFKFKITGRRNNSWTLNGHYAPKYKLKRERPLTQACFQAGAASGKVASVMDQAACFATYPPPRP